MNITDLPIGILTHVSSYLPTPTRALFAVSLTAPSSSWQDTNEQQQLSETSRAIMSPSSQWETLDFEEIEKSLAKKLNDNDLWAVLTCIKQTVKRLKLTGCTNITGRGLTPLQFCTVLELIDLSLLKQHEDDIWVSEPRTLSQEVVLPFLGSIISVQGCLLKYIQFPLEWVRSRSGRFASFQNSYIQHLNRLGISCSKCNNAILARGPRDTPSNSILFCCYNCLKPICVNCEGPRDNTVCDICKKVYCSGSGCCVSRERCMQCRGRKTVCSGCMGQCSSCEARCCNYCLHIEQGMCENCNGIRWRSGLVPR